MRFLFERLAGGKSYIMTARRKPSRLGARQGKPRSMELDIGAIPRQRDDQGTIRSQAKKTASLDTAEKKTLKPERLRQTMFKDERML
jgi:hypothetical protein